MPARSTQQHPLTIIATVRPELRERLVSSLDAARADVLARMKLVDTLHYGRFVVFDDAQMRARLAFESNYDGELDAHLALLAAKLGGPLDAFFGHCEGYTPGSFPAFARGHQLPAPTFYLSHPGLTVKQVQNDAAVRRACEDWLDARDREGSLSSMSPEAIAGELQAHLAGLPLTLGRVERGLPNVYWAGATAVPLVLAAGLAELALALVAYTVNEPRDRREMRAHPPALRSDQDPVLAAIVNEEDRNLQNGLTVVVPVKPGFVRRAALGVALWAIDVARRHIFFHGKLGYIATIHFARWVWIPKDPAAREDGGTLVFFSNYDGSWESYLGDFVDKSRWFLTAIWTNTKWFPDTHFLAWGGAEAEGAFKRWARTFQVRNQIWYSAYPDVSVDHVRDNATVRELAGTRPLAPDQVRSWLSLL